MEGSDSKATKPVELLTEKQQGGEVPAETSVKSEKSDVQSFEAAKTECSPTSSNVAGSVPKDDLQLSATGTSIIDSIDDGFGTTVTSSVSILRSDPWASMEVSATVPRNARITPITNDFEVSIDSKNCKILCDENDSKFPSDAGESNVSRKNDIDVDTKAKNESLGSKHSKSETSKKPENEKVEIVIASSDNQRKEQWLDVLSELQSTHLKQCEEKNANLKRAISCLVLPVIRITEVSDIDEDTEVSEELESAVEIANVEMVEKDETLKTIETFENEASVIDDSMSVGSGNVKVDNKSTPAVSEEAKEMASNIETCGNNEEQQIEESKAFFYISSTEIQPGRLERALGYTNLAFDSLDEASEWQNLRSMENNQSGPAECLGPTSLHGGIIMFSMFVSFVGYAIYSLAQEGNAPYICETIGLSTSAIAGAIAMLSALYVGVQWCCSCHPNANYEPIPVEDNETETLIDRESQTHSNSIETGCTEMERPQRPYESETSNSAHEEILYQNQPSTSGKSDAMQKLKSEVTEILETLADVISQLRMEDSANDFTSERMEAVPSSETASSDSCVYESAKLPLDSKDEEQDRPQMKD